MLMDGKIKEQVLLSQDAEELRKVALQQGMSTLFDQGLQLVYSGNTTSSELLRVTRLREEV